MSWQEEYIARYEARLAENWMPDGIRLSDKDAHCSTVYHLNGTSHRCIFPSEHEGQCTFLTLWNNLTNTREICGND